MLIFAIILTVLLLIYLISLKGRVSHPGLEKLRGWNYAHRGLHSKGVPENSLAAFLTAKEKGYGIELDVHLLKDGSLAVIHDSSLMRTAGVNRKIEDLEAWELDSIHLEGTQEKIPLFSEVLELYDGAAPIIVELKSSGNNQKQLCKRACELLDAYKGVYCIESFDPLCVYWLRRHRPDIIRGQLSDNFLKDKESKFPWIIRLIMSSSASHLIGHPDFTAFNYKERKNLGTLLCRKLWRVQGVAWTIRTKDDLDTAIKENWIPIFENFEP